jgi:nitrile hydratase
MTSAIQSPRYSGRQGEHMTAVENGAKVHNLISARFAPAIRDRCLARRRLVQARALSLARRYRSARVLAEFGVRIAPQGTEGWSEERLAALVRRD